MLIRAQWLTRVLASRKQYFEIDVIIALLRASCRGMRRAQRCAIAVAEELDAAEYDIFFFFSFSF